MAAPADDGSLGLVGDWATGVMEVLGGPGAGLLVAIENLFPPIPSELILPLAGFAAGQGTMSLAEAILWTLAGSVGGATIVYLLARWLGRDRTRRLFEAIPLLRPSDFDAAERWFRRHGRAAVLAGRLVPVFRSLISLPAGVTRMPFAVFVLLTAIGSGIWNTAFVLAGFVLGANWHLVRGWAEGFQWLVLGLVGVAIAVFVVVRARAARRERRDASGA